MAAGTWRSKTQESGKNLTREEQGGGDKEGRREVVGSMNEPELEEV